MLTDWDYWELITLSDPMEYLETMVTPGQVIIPRQFQNRRISAPMDLRELWSEVGLEVVRFMYHPNKRIG